MDKAPVLQIVEKCKRCNGTGIIESDIDRQCYCDKGMVARHATHEEQRDADDRHYMPRIQELEAQVKRLQIMLDVAHQACSEMEVKLNKYKEREQAMIALWGKK